MTNWFETRDGIWQKLWDTLGRGVADARHPARRPTFATVSPAGWPEARTVVLRSADRDAGLVTLHTDLYSGKVASLRNNARAALHIWDPKQDLQIRLQAEVDIQSGPQTQSLCDKIPDHARQSYGGTPPPGQPIQGALDYVKAPEPATFAVLSCAVMQIDAVHLGEQHRRCSFSRERGWEGQWLSP